MPLTAHQQQQNALKVEAYSRQVFQIVSRITALEGYITAIGGAGVDNFVDADLATNDDTAHITQAELALAYQSLVTIRDQINAMFAAGNNTNLANVLSISPE